jgi:hypothetical protein
MQEAWHPPEDRSWRGRPAAQRRGAQRLPFVVGAALVAFALLEPGLTRTLGGLWGEVAALGLTGAPIGAVWASAARGAGAGSAWKTGALFAFASAACYAWIFSGAWV